MKHLSNKKRKLQFIRKKNYVRLGGLLYLVFKVSQEALKEPACELESMAVSMIASQQKSLRLKLVSIKEERNLIDDDFVKDLYTMKITLKHD